MLVQESKLKKFILDSGLASRSEVLSAEKEVEKGGGSVGDVLVKQGKISADDLRRVQAYILGIPFVDLRGQKIDFSILASTTSLHFVALILDSKSRCLMWMT
jgi:hypothetical protein